MNHTVIYAPILKQECDKTILSLGQFGATES